jgi:flagellar M-ring protein FliF
LADIVSVAQNARSSARSFWSGLSQTQRAAIYTLGVLGVGLLALFVLWAKNPAYSVAYSGLSEQNAGAVVAKLKELNIPYKLETPGTILVPSEQVQDVRLQMAMAKLPDSGGVGYELFDQTNFGLTDFAQRVNYQRALEGELSRTIGKIEGVESARVHIVIPEQSLFSEAKKDTTASVVLQLRPGVKLAKAQMQGISRLVAGSVEGLKEGNLTVVDTRGNTLSVAADADGLDSDVFQTRADAQRALEASLESNIRSLLDKTLGPNKTAVQVRATLDWDKVEQANETYSPDGLQPQVRSQHKLLEDYPGGSRVAGGGIPGVGSNVPTYPQELATPTVTGTPAPSGPQPGSRPGVE